MQKFGSVEEGFESKSAQLIFPIAVFGHDPVMVGRDG